MSGSIYAESVLGNIGLAVMLVIFTYLAFIKWYSRNKAINIGAPIKIISSDGDHTFKMNTNELEKLLLQDDIKDRNVIVVSVAGAFRKGKSFLLNYLLRYLYAQVSYEISCRVSS